MEIKPQYKLDLNTETTKIQSENIFRDQPRATKLKNKKWRDVHRGCPRAPSEQLPRKLVRHGVNGPLEIAYYCSLYKVDISNSDY